MSDVLAIVVHHASLLTLRRTTEELLAEGIDRERIVVVDNSEDLVSTSDLQAALPDGIALLRVPNRGYAAAVNLGLDHHARSERFPSASGVLVVTHEVVFARGAVDALARLLAGCPDLALIAPVLVNGDPSSASTSIWSAGGNLTRLGVPRHSRRVSDQEVDRVTWVDGSVALYRPEVVVQRRLHEDYFMYFEEVDFHLGLRRDGWSIGVARSAMASQHTMGMPPFYAARGFRLFHRRWFGRRSHVIAVLAFSLRWLPALVASGNMAGAREFIRGLRAPLSSDDDHGGVR